MKERQNKLGSPPQLLRELDVVQVKETVITEEHFRAEDIEGKTITDALRTVQPSKWYGREF
jgi:hypothetical protein